MCMLSLYADESGTDGRSPVVVVAGYVASADSWAAFQVEWKQFCDDNKIKDFHATDFLAHKKEFTVENGWTDKRTESATRIVDNIISKHVEFGVVAVTIIADCEKLFPVKGRKKFSFEYAAAAMVMANEVTKWADKKGYTEPIQFIFDRGPHGKGYVMSGIDRWRDMNHERSHLVGGYSFPCRNQYPQLLAADWVVNYTGRISQNYLRDSKTWNRKISERLGKLKVEVSCKIDRKLLLTTTMGKIANSFYEETDG